MPAYQACFALTLFRYAENGQHGRKFPAEELGAKSRKQADSHAIQAMLHRRTNFPCGDYGNPALEQ